MSKPKIKISVKEMIKSEIKKHSKLKRSRATSFHYGSETPETNDNNFEGFDFSMGKESKTPLIPKNSFKSFSFKTMAPYEDLDTNSKKKD
mmetsp:Transcript_7186/g.6380  ORF Transcript_7186/g.6380 Transcript_7186/m.6380 type:complete len:90 (+) Transcript_7186:898-1167(+)